jgi:predicted nucleotidyltransferase
VKHVQEIEDHLRAMLASAPPQVVAAYLYGSVARGTAGPRSDIDVGVLLGAPPPPTLEGHLFDYEGELERALRRPVQLVILNMAPADLIHRILRDGRILLDRDPPARIRFEVRSRNEYFDILPFLQRYRGQSPAGGA